MILTPLQSLAMGALWGLIIAVCGGAFVEWSRWIKRRLDGVKTHSVVPGPQATVGFVDILVTVLVLMMLFFSAAVTWSAMGIKQNPFLYSGFAISSQLVCVILMTIFVCRRTGCNIARLGWRKDQIQGDLRAGWQCFLMMTPIILILNAVLQGATKTPYEHPIQEMIKQYPWLLGIAFWQAAIVAPISEEFGFRVLLIGWFESIQFGNNKMMAFIFGASPDKVEELNERATVLPPVMTTQCSDNPFEAPEIIGGTLEYVPPWLPVLLSGTLFGLAHFSYGVSWVALIVFGVVLGRLYQLRQSIIPVIMVHVLFNAMNVTMLGLSLLLPTKLMN